MTESETHIAELDEQVLSLLEDAMGMELGLSEDDSDYQLSFIREKLAKCSTFQERISDVMMRLTRVSIEVQRKASSSKMYEKSLENTLRGGEEYQNMDRAVKTAWLNGQLKDAREETERWNSLKRAVSEVKEAVGERAATLKRLDSDLRLHTKLLEMSNEEGRGATSPTAFTGSDSPELDID